MTKEQTQVQQMLAGTQKDLPATSTVDFDGQELKQSDIVAKLEGWIQLFEQKDVAKAAAGTAATALKAAGIPVQGDPRPGAEAGPREEQSSSRGFRAGPPPAEGAEHGDAYPGASQERGDASGPEDHGVGAEEGREGARCDVSHRVPERGSVGGVGGSAAWIGWRFSTATVTPQAAGSPLAAPVSGAVPIGGGGK